MRAVTAVTALVASLLWAGAAVGGPLGDPAACDAAQMSAARGASSSAKQRPGAYLILSARALVEDGQIIAAIAQQTLAIELDPLDAFAFRERALTWHRQKRYELAVADFTRALELAPRDPLSYFGRAQSLHAAGEIDAALKDYARASGLRPRWSDPIRMRGHALLARADYKAAAAEFRRGLDADSRDMANLAGLGYARFYMGDLALAADNFTRSLRLSNNIRAMLFLYLVRAQQGTDGKAELARYARYAGPAWPSPVLHLFLGRTTPEQLNAAARDEVQVCEAQFYIGQWMMTQGRRAEGLALLKQAVNRCPKTQVEYEAALATVSRAGM